MSHPAASPTPEQREVPSQGEGGGSGMISGEAGALHPNGNQSGFARRQPTDSGSAQRHCFIRRFGQVDYEPTWRAMQAFNTARTDDTPDELWLVQHPPVYTLGLAGKPEHLLRQTDIPLVPIDRGGQITYHGPGQIVLYLMLDLKRHQLGIRELVRKMEGSVIELLQNHGVNAHGDPDAPGVYVDSGAKIAALGLRIRRGCSYHGLALNVDMDLTPFSWINPCGYQGMAVTQARDEGVTAPLAQLENELLQVALRQILPNSELVDAPATYPVAA